MTLACYGDAWVHRAIYAAIGTCMYVFGIPALFVVCLFRNKDKLDEADVLARFGLLYAGYAAHFWLGELVEMTRKMVLTGYRAA